MEPAPKSDRWRGEWVGVAVLTLVGAGIRLRPPGRFGLTHFDEGIYALVGSWSLSPGGLAGIDPSLVPYAPPGFPILVGIAYVLLGRSDASAIVVSQLAGTLTIPVIAWMARRSFGPGAGFASATFVTFSGAHIAFSRMALTDASALLAWLVAIAAGLRFLARPGPVGAVGMGLAVGLAQQFKYNGWLTGAIVVGSAVLGVLRRRDDRRAGPVARVFGWGTVAAGVAWLVVWPWYRFVERHGGYADLLRHQRSYLGGLGQWWPYLLAQAEQAVGLSGSRAELLLTMGVAALTPIVARPDPWGSMPWGRFLLLWFGFAWTPLVLLEAPYALGLIVAPWLAILGKPASRTLAVWWAVLAVMSPFYHPYARLWLPFHAVNWLLMGGMVANAPRLVETLRGGSGSRPWGSHRLAPILASGLIASIPGLGLRLLAERRAFVQAGLLSPSDSLRSASSRVVSSLPKDVEGLRLLVRPAVTFYLAGRTGLYPMSGSDQLRVPGNPRVWALVDSAILGSESGRLAVRDRAGLLAPFLDRWELVEEFPTTLSLPTLFDLDPASARVASADRSAPLWLLRPRRNGTSR